ADLGSSSYPPRRSSDLKPGEPFFRGSVSGQPVVARVAPRPDGVRVVHGGAEVDIAVRTPRAAELARLMPEKLPPDMSKFLLCPMPGLVVSINVSEGEPVKAGQDRKSGVEGKREA